MALWRHKSNIQRIVKGEEDKFREKEKIAVSMKSISILGAGSWGTAIATVAAERGVEVHLWSRNAKHLEEIAEA